MSRTIPATGKAPERTVECDLALTYRRQTDSGKGSGTSGMLDHLKKQMKAWQDVQKNRSSSSATTKKKLGEIYHADGEEGLESTAWHAFKQYRPGAENNNR